MAALDSEITLTMTINFSVPPGYPISTARQKRKVLRRKILELRATFFP
uniref:Uncharacterized protein n=1 Tax=Anguilla anguilla TaxID=7936 RepID=A0A0E9URM4_ANGAN